MYMRALSVTDPACFQENIEVAPSLVLVQLPISVNTAAVGHAIATFDGCAAMAS